MRGTILDYGDGKGLILGDDGSRYNFMSDQWRGERNPAARQPVDFVGVGESASQIYPLRNEGADVGAAIGSAVHSRIAAAEKALNNQDVGENLTRLRGALATRPQVVIAVILIIASFMMTWLSMSADFGIAGRSEISLAGAPEFASTIKGPLEAGLATAQQAMEMMGGLSGSYGAEAILAGKAAIGRMSRVLTFLQLAPVLYLIPLGATLLVFLEYRQKRMRLVELTTGIMALASLAVALLGREAMAQAVKNNFAPSSETLMRSAIMLGWGAWVIGLCGVGLVLTALGRLRRTPGL